MPVDRSEGPTAEQEVEHLAGQCTTLLRENERLRAALNQFVAACDTAPPTGLIREIGMARKAAGKALGLME